MSGDGETGIQVRRLDDEGAYVGELEGEVVANLTYARRDGRVVLLETTVLPSMRGRGIAGALISGALDDLRERGESVRVECPAVAGYLSRHPEYADLTA